MTENELRKIYNDFEKIDDVIKFQDLIVVECPQCGNKIVTSCAFGSGAFHCDKCSPQEIVRFDFYPLDEIKKNQRDNWTILSDYVRKRYFNYVR